jgi:hypothetical protein
VPGSAIVKLALQPRTDAEFALFCESLAQAMAGNPWFPSPQPSVQVFDEKLVELEQMLSELENLRLQVLNLTQRKDRIRQEMEFLVNQRGSYVQMRSRGNADVIASAGLSARRPRSRLGTLPAPEGLHLLVTQISGELLVRWNKVPGARTYLLESAPVLPDQPHAWEQVHIGGQLRCLIAQLTPGQTYAFRLAAIGGATGRSAWSPVVQRMVG